MYEITVLIDVDDEASADEIAAEISRIAGVVRVTPVDIDFV